MKATPSILFLFAAGQAFSATLPTRQSDVVSRDLVLSRDRTGDLVNLELADRGLRRRESADGLITKDLAPRAIDWTTVNLSTWAPSNDCVACVATCVAGVVANWRWKVTKIATKEGALKMTECFVACTLEGKCLGSQWTGNMNSDGSMLRTPSESAIMTTILRAEDLLPGPAGGSSPKDELK